MSLSEAWHAAIDMRRKFASEAVRIAATRADRCFDLGDLDGFRAWNRITHSILEIERRPDLSEVRH